MKMKPANSVRCSLALLAGVFIGLPWVAGCGETVSSEDSQAKANTPAWPGGVPGKRTESGTVGETATRVTDGSRTAQASGTGGASGTRRTGTDGEPGPAKKMRTRSDIFLDRLRVETLYLTKDGERVIQPMTPTGVVIVDADAGTLAHIAWQCNNPDCPARHADGSPFLFIRPNPFLSLGTDGAITIGTPREDNDSEIKTWKEFCYAKCPECLKLRDLASESEKEAEQYLMWCRQHVLPSATTRFEELENEHRALVAHQRRRAAE